MEHPIHQEITDLLRQHDCWFEDFEHEAVRTSEEAAALRPNYTTQQAAKAIIIRVKVPNIGKKFAMLVLPGDQKFDSAKVKQLLHSKDLRFASEDEVEAVTNGIKPGGVPPFGNLFDLEVLCDPSVLKNERIIFNAGRTTSIAIKSADYKKLVQPRIEAIV